MLAVLSVLMVCLQGFVGLWYVQGIRFMILFSSIIPIRLAYQNYSLLHQQYACQLGYGKTCILNIAYVGQSYPWHDS